LQIALGYGEETVILRRHWLAVRLAISSIIPVYKPGRMNGKIGMGEDANKTVCKP